MELLEIAHCQELAPILARWHVREWGHLYAGWTEPVAEAEFRAMTPAGSVPTTWVAFRDGGDRSVHSVLGSVSIITDDELPGFEDVGPWLASLYVVPEARGAAVGSALVRAVIGHCRAVGIGRLHLFTAGQEQYYLDRGWHVLATADANGEPVTVMAIDTDQHAPKRSVVSGWIGDPNSQGAYSYLRPGGTPADRERLARMIAPGLWFAGEATSREFPGTMHGAWFSGVRAAEHVHAAAGRTEVAVVGAGLAGLAAAGRLTELGHGVTVFEATARPGGRTRADTTLGVTVHLGAAWLHGDAGNPIGGIDGGVRAIAWDWDETPTFVVGRGQLDGNDEQRLGALLERIEQQLDTPGPDQDAALAPMLDTIFRRTLADPNDRTVLSCWLRSKYEKLYAAPMHDLSLLHRAEPYRLPGPDAMIISSLDDFIARASRGIDARYQTRVMRISARSTGGFTLTTPNSVALDSSAVIVTVPVGVLRSGGIQFAPALPDDVTHALDVIGSGPVAKVFYTFDEAWWAPNKAFWVADEPPAALEFWVDVTALAGRPTLCAFATGAHAIRLEQTTEDERLVLASSVLRSAGLPSSAENSR